MNEFKGAELLQYKASIMLLVNCLIEGYSCSDANHRKVIRSEFIGNLYPRSLNISLHLIISDFARRRQSLKSKCSQIITNQRVCIQINTKHRQELSSISRVSSHAKCEVREKITPRQFVKNKVPGTLSDLGLSKSMILQYFFFIL